MEKPTPFTSSLRFGLKKSKLLVEGNPPKFPSAKELVGQFRPPSLLKARFLNKPPLMFLRKSVGFSKYIVGETCE